MSAPGRLDVEDRARAVALLPEEHHEAPDGADRDDVEHDRLQRQQQRAEHPREQDVGDDDDHQDHPDEVAVDRVVEVDAARHGAADQHLARARRRPRRAPADTLRGAVLLAGKTLTTAVSPRRHACAGRGDRPAHAVDAARRPRRRGRRRRLTTATSYGVSTPAPMPESLELVEAPRARRPAEASASARGVPVEKSSDRDEQSGQDGERDARRRASGADHEPAPGHPALAGARRCGGLKPDAVEPRARRSRASPAAG